MKNKLIGASVLAILLSGVINESRASLTADEDAVFMGATSAGATKLAKEVVENKETFDGYVQAVAGLDDFVGGGGVDEDVPAILQMIGPVPGATILDKTTTIKGVLSANPLSPNVHDAIVEINGLINAPGQDIAEAVGHVKTNLVGGAANNLTANVLAVRKALMEGDTITAGVNGVRDIVGGPNDNDLYQNVLDAQEVVNDGGAPLNAPVGTPGSLLAVQAALHGGAGGADLATQAAALRKAIVALNNHLTALRTGAGPYKFPHEVEALAHGANSTIADLAAWIETLY